MCRKRARNESSRDETVDKDRDKSRKRRKKRRNPTEPIFISPINSSAVTQPILDRFFKPGLITFHNVKSPLGEVTGATTVEILTDVLGHMKECGMFTTSDQIEVILKENVSNEVKAACDDIGKWMDIIISQMSFISTKSKRIPSYEKLSSICSQYRGNDSMLWLTRRTILDGLLPLAKEMADARGDDLQVMWRNLWRRLLEFTLDDDKQSTRQIRDNHQSKYEVELVGKPSPLDILVASDNADDPDETSSDEDSSDVLVKACFISKPDLIYAATIHPSEVSHRAEKSLDICVIEVKTSKIVNGEEEIWDTGIKSASGVKCKGNSTDGKTVKKGGAEKTCNPNSRLYQLDKQHFLQLFSALRQPFVKHTQMFTYRVFGLYIIMDRVYPTAIDVKTPDAATKSHDMSQKAFRSANFISQNSYITMPKSEETSFNMAVGPYFNLFKTGHLRAFLAYMNILTKNEYQYMDHLNM